ncbi:MAG TPA: class I SAM-dependent methyltransferase [Acidimicrobiia bacterium]|nr:class I SAM-dependent methyltransferase [Acidimicrobiia bacterium]
MTEWDESLAEWWLDEVASDPAYRSEVLPLALEVLRPEAGKTYLDLGCGEGRVLAAVAATGARSIGVDASPRLAAEASTVAPVVVGTLPDLGFVRDEAVDGVVVVLVLEHLEDHARLFSEAARVTRPGGVLALVINHPLITAPDSAPIIDDDGEVLWRWGRYFARGHTEEPAGDLIIRFHHRTLSDLMGAAASVGWALEAISERGAGPERAAIDPIIAGQIELPRLLAARWRRVAAPADRPG